MRRALALLGAVLTAAALTLTACGTDPGMPGRVVAKEKDTDCHGTGRSRSCDTDYELTTRNKDGDTDTFDVTSSVYNDCYRGSAYPKCANR